jgi:ABC-type anion transport system duplicated permease subunit
MLFMVSRSEREYSFDERTRKVQTQTWVPRHCDISWVQSNEDSVLFFLMVGINMLLSDIIVYDAYSCLSFVTYSLSVALVRERTIPTERPPLVGEVSANFCG